MHLKPTGPRGVAMIALAVLALGRAVAERPRDFGQWDLLNWGFY